MSVSVELPRDDVHRVLHVDQSLNERGRRYPFLAPRNTGSACFWLAQPIRLLDEELRGEVADAIVTVGQEEVAQTLSCFGVECFYLAEVVELADGAGLDIQAVATLQLVPPFAEARRTQPESAVNARVLQTLSSCVKEGVLACVRAEALADGLHLRGVTRGILSEPLGPSR